MAKAAPAWQTQLKRIKDGKGLESCKLNAFIIFSNDPRWQGVLGFDEMVGDLVALKPPPWGDLVAKPPAAGRWLDTDTVLAGLWLRKNYAGFQDDFPNTHLCDALLAVGRRTSFHPVRDWLNSLKWDGAPRLDDWLSRLCLAEDGPYTRAVASKFLLGAVARAMVPGAKVDTMPVFEGEQGIGKSTLLRELCGEEWFLETGIELGNKDSYQILRGKWIVELSELDSLQRSELSRVKAYLTARVDTYRPSYGRTTVSHPRCVVFAGTTNADQYLKDDTGNRRFHPVALGTVNIAGVRAERDQLWAEAVARYNAGEVWHFDSEEIRQLQTDAANDRRQPHPWEFVVALYLSKRSSEERAKGVSTHTILTSVLGIAEERQTRTDEMQAAQVLRHLGWGNHVRVRVGSYLTWLYKPNSNLELVPNVPTSGWNSEKRLEQNSSAVTKA